MAALIEAAIRAREHAHAPFSGFKVGAAVETGDGRIYSGCNVENVTYSLTLCAERVAIFKAISEGARRPASRIRSRSASGISTGRSLRTEARLSIASRKP